MATTKKKPTTKKSSVTKKATAKSSQGSKRARPLTWRFYAVTIGIFLIAVATVIVLAYITAGVIARQNNQGRLDRINSIYSSLNIDDTYDPTTKNVFGDKRVYDWDAGRTYSSEVNYIHADTVNNTVADLDTKIKAAGFTFTEEPYPGSKEVQYHYKSSNGEYVRLTVKSKPYWDAMLNASTMNEEPSEAVRAMDTNTGPSAVTVKVNLDDNNE